MTVPGRDTIDELMSAVPAPDADSLARLHADLVARSERAALLDVAYRTVDSPLGPLLLAATPAGVVRVAFAGEGHDDVLTGLATLVSPRILRGGRRLDEAARQLADYFAGRRRTFDLAIDLRLAHGFRRDVLLHLRDDPLRGDAELRRRRPRRRAPAGRAGSRHGVRQQPGAPRRALPPRRAQ